MAANFLRRQDFPTDSKPDALIKLQAGLLTPVVCNFGVDGLEISNSSTSFNARFNISPSLIAPCFILEMMLAPARGDRPSPQQTCKGQSMRMYAIFLGYDEAEPNTHGDREVFSYTSPKESNPPSGPLSFSRQLETVKYCRADDISAVPTLRHEGVDASKQYCFSWCAKTCVVINRSLPTAELSQESRNAAETFGKIIDAVVKSKKRITVVVKQPRFAECFWPRFASIPAPVPESQFLWVFPLDKQEPLEVMRFPPTATCERNSDMVDLLLAQRHPRWYDAKDKKTFEDVFASKLGATSTAVKIAKLSAVTHFLDGRHYMATVLGCQSYEARHSKVTTATWFNGDHTCDILPDQHDSRKFVILLNLRPPTNAEIEETGGSGDLPTTGERVRVSYLTTGSDYHKLDGTVERMPQALLSHGRNICIVAYEPATMPQRGHIARQYQRFKASFQFGHFGSLHTPTQERITSLMTNTWKIKPAAKARWIKQLLLAQDNHADIPFAPAPKNWKVDVDRISHERGLNDDQKAVLVHFCQSRITLVQGPPGTGKSTVIDAIRELQEVWGKRSWIVTGSNAACDVLVRKTTIRKGGLQPDGLLRVKPAAEERLQWIGTGSERCVEALDDQPVLQGEETLQQAIARLLAEKENVSRAMSLAAVIKKRFNLRPQMARHQVKLLYPNECTDFDRLHRAVQASSSHQVEGCMAEESVEDQARLERQYQNQLRQAQRNYVSQARAVYTTAGAANSALLRNIRPYTVIMDEASQVIEAEAVSALLHAMEGDEFARVVLIGDDKQLGPSVFAPRNPFSETGKVSLFERFILSGVKTLMLRKQYRMHSDISSICNSAIYRDFGGITDGENTRTQPGVTEAQRLLKSLGGSNFPVTNCAVVSPADDPKLSFKLR